MLVFAARNDTSLPGLKKIKCLRHGDRVTGAALQEQVSEARFKKNIHLFTLAQIGFHLAQCN